MKLKISGDVLFFVALLGLLAFVSGRISQPGESGVSQKIHRTVENKNPSGYRAFATLLTERKNRVGRTTRAPNAWPTDAAVVICATPYNDPTLFGDDKNDWTDAQATDALTWAENGGVIVILTDTSDALTDSLGLKFQSPESGKLVVSPTLPGLLDRVRRVSGGDRTFDDPPNFSVAFLQTVSLPGAAHGLLVPWGDGFVFALSNPSLADNAHLAKADNARLVTSVVEWATRRNTSQRTRVLFDEFHQGSQVADNLWTFVGRGGQLAAYQLGATLLLGALAMGIRFGKPRPLPPTSRNTGEYVSSIANLYRRASATDAALVTILDDFLAELSHVGGGDSSQPDGVVAMRAAAALGGGEDLARALTRVLADGRAFLTASESGETTGKQGERELLKITREIDRLQKEWRIGRDSGTG